ncbi:MAG: glycosyltransferase involved in cell wall biosynthesis [Planctomycetaceae bacterium]|jgi:glycosyltransferase involved in cell wall biosynthesis
MFSQSTSAAPNSEPSPDDRRVRPRILQILASGPGGGGMERHFFDLCNGLAESHEVIAVCEDVYKSGLSSEVQFEDLGHRIGRRSPRTIFRFWRIANACKPDLIHAHSSRAAAIVSSCRWGVSAPRVATVHGQKNSHHVFRHFDGVIAVSHGVAKQIRHRNVSVVYNGIDPAAWSRSLDQAQDRPDSFPDSGRIAVAIGRLVDVKGFDILIRAWQGQNGHLLIVGDGPLEDKLRALIAQCGLTKNVSLLGFRSDIREILNAADVLVIPSRREGFGYVLAEALLAGCPVVSTDVPAANEILPRQFIVPCEDVASLQQRLAETMAKSDSELRAEFGPVWARAEQAFALNTMLTETAKVYQSLLQQRV